MNIRFQIPHSCDISPLCPYCSVRHGFEKAPVKGDPGQWWKGIQQIRDDYPHSYFCFIYGEPFSYKNLVGWMGMLSRTNKVDCVTNLVNTHEMIEQYFLNPSNLVLTASYHPHYWGDIEKFDREIDKVNKTGARLNSVFLLGYPPYIPHLLEWKKHFESKKINVYMNAFYGEYKDKKYPDNYNNNDKEIILGSSYGNKTIFMKTKGMLCNAGKDIVYVKWNGDVTSCYTSNYYTLGNILTDRIKFFIEPKPCLSDICDCPDMFVNYLIGADNDRD